MQSHRQKRLKNALKNVLHTRRARPKYTGFFADFRDLYIFEKSLDFCDFLIYYSVRYSGIVQSVEQRTVNPYVTGSSPVARATNIKGSSRNPFSLIFLLLPICYPGHKTSLSKILAFPVFFKYAVYQRILI